MNKKKHGKKEKRSIILLVAVAVLIILLIRNIESFIDEVTVQDYYFKYEQSDMERAFRDHDYPELMYMVERNQARNLETAVDTSEYVAMAYYYEAMIYYKMYNGNDDEKAIHWKEKADQYKNQLESARFLEVVKQIEEN